MSFTTVVSFILVGACWGCTTPFIKDGTSAKLEDKSDIPDDDQLHPGRRAGGTPAAATPTADKSRLKRMLAPLRSLTSMRAMVPFALNQSGSTLFYYLLSSQGGPPAPDVVRHGARTRRTRRVRHQQGVASQPASAAGNAGSSRRGPAAPWLAEKSQSLSTFAGGWHGHSIPEIICTVERRVNTSQRIPGHSKGLPPRATGNTRDLRDHLSRIADGVFRGALAVSPAAVCGHRTQLLGIKGVAGLKGGFMSL